MSNKGAKHLRKLKREGIGEPPPGRYNVMAYALYRAGMKEASIACTMLAAWLIAREGLGHFPRNVEEYCDWWKQSYATGYRELTSFRRAYPFDSPTELAQAWKLRVPLLSRGERDPSFILAWLTEKKVDPYP